MTKRNKLTQLQWCGCFGALLLLVAFTPFAYAQNASVAIAAASKALGADNLNTIEYSGSGYDFAFGQAYSRTSPWPKFLMKSSQFLKIICLK